MNDHVESVVKERQGYRSRYLLVLALAVILALSVGTMGTAFAAQEELDQPVDPQIVGGTPVADGQYPFVTRLTVSRDQGNFLCGGSLIDQSHVLTAAHCVDRAPRAVRATVGQTNRNDESQGVVRDVTNVSIHPNFNLQKNSAYDVAVLKLDRPIRNIQPIALARPKTEANKPKEKATVAGYGRTSEGGATSDRLREAQVPIVSGKSCKADYANEEAELEVFPKIMICAGKNTGGVDACQGDSGGPLFRKINGKLRQIGIVSFGKGCARAQFPGVYTKITADPILSFIQQSTSKAAPAEVPDAA